jgi:hypothetical protein
MSPCWDIHFATIMADIFIFFHNSRKLERELYANRRGWELITTKQTQSELP